MKYQHTTQLLASSPYGLRAQALAAVDETIQLGRRKLFVEIGDLHGGEAAAVSALSAAARRMRAAGGSVQVITGDDTLKGMLPRELRANDAAFSCRR
jgi:hypothetical protein